MKSNVSDLLKLAHVIYLDACAKCPADVSDLRDELTISSRVEMEGLSFLTITLPAFCRDFERCLALGFIDPSLFRSFRKSGATPAFLQGMLGHLFDRETGRILENADSPIFVESIRQICLAFKKAKFPCTVNRNRKAIDNFKQNEHLFDDFSVPQNERERFLSVSDMLWHNLLADISLDQIQPRHGPGTTSERILGNQKYRWKRWHDRLERVVPLFGNGYTLGSIDESTLREVTIVPEDEEQPVRVILVPKTLKSPRVIAAEPVCMQFVQQGISEILVDRLESYVLTRQRINFSRQSFNQRLAITSSKTGQFATIDLSDASDRVPADLALEMFRSNPELQAAVDACRSKRAELPDRTIVPLRKFASMGSALCFPVEAMYFYTICVVALLDAKNLPLTYDSLQKACRQVYVYGDDIIVPTTYAGAVLDHLHKYNCKVNHDKTFVTGKFRESCGVDAYAGELVTPVYVRRERPKNRQQVSEIISWVKTANSFYLKGYWRAATHMYSMCEKLIGPLPYVSQNSSLLGRVSLMGYRSVHRWNPNLHRLETRGYQVRAVKRCDSLDGYAALTKCLHLLERRSSSKVQMLSEISSSNEKDHLEHSVRRGAVTLKLRWAPIHI